MAAASGRTRSRKGVVVVAVTAASLGLGGLVAAGPEIFPPAFDAESIAEIVGRDDTTVTLPDAVVDNPASPAAPNVVPGADGAAQPPAIPGTDRATPADPHPDADPGNEANGSRDCVDDGHGDDVADAARTTDPAIAVNVAARPECGEAAEAGPPASTPAGAAPGKPDAPGTQGEGAATPPADPGQPADAGNPTDAGQPADAGQPTDAGQPAETGGEPPVAPDAAPTEPNTGAGATPPSGGSDRAPDADSAGEQPAEPSGGRGKP